ncbi:MAG TPA: restriction endonuclease subunit S [Microbacterium sp.]|nr:restriction endonuclease subunit S [Microbacterium sp.]
MSSGHGIAWAPDLPEHWTASHLRWITSIYAGGTPDRNNADYWRDGTVPWLNSGSVNDWSITKPSEFISEAGLSGSSARWVPPRSVVVGLAGQGKTKGTAARLEIPATTNQSMAAIIPGGTLEYRYLHYWLVSNYQSIRNLAGGDKRDGLNLQHIAGIEIPLPPFDEQLAIADYLDRETARIDTLIAKQEQLIATLRERRSATVTQLSLEGLDPTVETAQHPFLGVKNASWSTARFGRVISISGGLVDPRTERWRDSILFAPNHIESGTGRIIGRETAMEQGADSGKYVVKAGQILYSKIRPALNKVAVASEDGLCSADMYALSAASSFDRDYLAYYLLSNPFLAFATMTSMRVKMPKVNREELGEAVIPLPPLPEQKEIADAITAATTKIDTLIAKAQRFIELSKERRAALITAAVTGQLEIPA